MTEFRVGEPCGHPGCLNHISHPCEGCGRTGGFLRLSVTQLAEIIYSTKFRYCTEKMLQHDLATLFDRLNLCWYPEVRLGPRDRIDFLIKDGIGVEVKTGHPLNHLIRQLFRYAESSLISEILVVSTKSRHHGVPDKILNKPVRVVVLSPFL